MTSSRFVLATAILGFTLAPLAAQSLEAELQRAVQKELASGDLNASISEYLAIAARAGSTNRVVAAQAQLRAADAQAKSGDSHARASYEHIVTTFPDQAAVVARARAALTAAAGQGPSGDHSSTARLIWSGPDAAGGRLSPDGRFMTFQIGNTGDLAIRDLTSNTTRNLTNTGGWVASGDYVEESIISPDSRRVAYTWFVEKDDRYELRVMALAPGTATPQTVVRPDSASDYVAAEAWTPDSRQLIVRRQQGKTWQIGIVSIEDGSFRRLKSLEWRNSFLSLSPDGRYVAYDSSASNGSPRDIYLLAVDGSTDVPLVQHPADDGTPFWSPDGSKVLFASDRTGVRALWSQPVAGGKPTGTAAPVKPNPLTERVNILGISRSGALYYVRRGASRQNVYLSTVDATGVTSASRRPIGNAINANQGPAWSRDGRYLAYYSAYNPTLASRPSASMLVVRDLTTGVDRVLPLPVTIENTPLNPGPKWFPGNRFLLILTREPQGAGLAFHRFDLENGRSELLWRITEGTHSFDVSPDGKALYCQQPTRLVRYDIETRRETVLATGASYTAIALSPDGTQLASFRSVREKKGEAPGIIEVRPSSGGAAREVYRHPIWYDGTRFNTLAWTPDGRALLFARAEDDTPYLWRVPVQGGTPSKIGLSGGIKTPVMRPGGKEIAFGLRENDDNEVWMLENVVSASQP